MERTKMDEIQVTLTRSELRAVTFALRLMANGLIAESSDMFASDANEYLELAERLNQVDRSTPA